MTLFTVPSAGETARKAWATSGVLRFWGRAVVALVGLRRPSFFDSVVSASRVHM